MDSEEITNRLRCPCCGQLVVDPRMVMAIRHIFGMLGHEVPINSGYRCEKHNAEVGGALKSLHLVGKAVDLGATDPDEQEDIVSFAKRLGFSGFGWGRNFIHLDFGPEREWRYGADGKQIYKESH